MSNHALLVFVFVLCACASPPQMERVVPQQGLATDAANGETEIKTLAAFERGSPSDEMQGQPKPMRIYWFFGDR